MNIKWDADKYTKDFSFVHQYGNDVAELINCEKGGTLIDLGCGSGALTKVLQEKGFRVTGMDSSEELLETARRKYPGIPFIWADAADFSVEEAVDVIFSNAVFHWIDKEKQTNMLACVHRALKGKGQFVFEFGGHGNNARIHGVLAEVFSEHGYEKEWIRMFVKTPFAKVDNAERDEIINQAVERLKKSLYREGRWYADYVRIRMKAVNE